MIAKNVQYITYFACVKTDGTADTSTTPTVEVSKDAGSFATTTNSAVRIGSTHVFYVTLTLTEMNADVICLKVTGTGLVPYTQFLSTESVWTSTKAGYLDSAISGIAAGVWVIATSALSGAGTIGKLLVDNVNAVLSTIATHLTDIKGATWLATTDSLEAIRDRGDTAWITGSGASADNSYFAGSATVVTGTPTGTVSNIQLVDGSYYQIQEIGTTNPGIDYNLVFTAGVDTHPESIEIWAYYSGNATHYIRVQALVGGTGTSWEDVGTITNGNIVTRYSFKLTPEHINHSNGNVQIRFVHNSVAGISSHYLYLDKILLTSKNIVSNLTASDVWANAARTITGGTITTNSDKTGYTVSTVSDKTGYTATVSDKTGFELSSTGILAIWHQLLSGIVTTSTIGKLIKDYLDAQLSLVKAKTDNIPASPAAVGSAMTLAADSVNATALATTAVDEIAGAILSNTANKLATDASGRVVTVSLAAGSITAAAIQDNAITNTKIADGAITAGKIATDAITNDKLASSAITEIQSGLATSAEHTTITSKIDVIDGIVDTITGHIQADYTSTEKAAIDLIDDANGLINIHDTVDAVKTKTDQLTFTQSNKVDATAIVDTSALATAANLATVDTVVDAIKVKTDQLTFTQSNKVDATATATVDESAIATAIVSQLGGATIEVTSPVAESGNVTIYRGTDYNSYTTAIVWTVTGWATLVGKTATFNCSPLGSLAITITNAGTATQTLTLNLSDTQTMLVPIGNHKFTIVVTDGSNNSYVGLEGKLISKDTVGVSV